MTGGEGCFWIILLSSFYGRGSSYALSFSPPPTLFCFCFVDFFGQVSFVLLIYPLTGYATT